MISPSGFMQVFNTAGREQSLSHFTKRSLELELSLPLVLMEPASK